MSNSRYVATESQFTISPANFSASASESAVFPLAVGPRITTSRGSEEEDVMDSRPTLSAGSRESGARSESKSEPAAQRQPAAIRSSPRHTPRGGDAAPPRPVQTLW